LGGTGGRGWWTSWWRGLWKRVVKEGNGGE